MATLLLSLPTNLDPHAQLVIYWALWILFGLAILAFVGVIVLVAWLLRHRKKAPRAVGYAILTFLILYVVYILVLFLLHAVA